jgi:hypothetical protein
LPEPVPLPIPPVHHSKAPRHLIRAYRRLFSLSRRWGHARGKARKLADTLDVCLRTFRYWLADLIAMGWIVTSTDGRMTYIWPMIPLPPEDEPSAGERRTPAPPVPVPPIAHLVAQAKRKIAPRYNRPSYEPAVTGTDSRSNVPPSESERPPSNLPPPLAEMVADRRLSLASAAALARRFSSDCLIAAARAVRSYAARHTVRDWAGILTSAARDWDLSAAIPPDGRVPAAGPADGLKKRARRTRWDEEKRVCVLSDRETDLIRRLARWETRWKDGDDDSRWRACARRIYEQETFLYYALDWAPPAAP